MLTSYGDSETLELLIHYDNMVSMKSGRPGHH